MTSAVNSINARTQKSSTIVHYFACRAHEEPIIYVSLLSGVLWDELKCEFNLLGAKVNFRRGISRCALWGVYATLPLRDVSVGLQPQISVWQPATALWCGGIDTHSLCSPPHPALTSLLTLSAAGAFAWSSADNLDCPLQPSPLPRLSIKSSNQADRGGGSILTWMLALGLKCANIVF